MGVKKGGQGSEHAPSTVLAAVLLADSFTCKFRPITIERPKVLLPLVNVPMIEYSLEWLSGNGVEEVYIFCCAHAQQVVDYIQSSKWRTPATSPAQMIVKPIISHNSLSVGDALRLVDEKKLISSDFVLVSADVVSNMDLAKAIQVHKQRRNESKSSIMTIVMRNARHPLHARRLGDQDQLVALDSSTNQLIQYSVLDQKAGTHSFQNFKIDATAFSERDSIQVRSDLLDVGIYICAPEVLVIYSDNFDYQNIRKDFIQGVLSEEELGNKLYAYPLSREYAAQVHNMRSYDAVSRDIIGRWTYPYVPDTNIFSKKLPATLQTSDLCETIFRMNRGNIYRELTSRIEQMVSVQRGSFIGPATVIKSTSQIVESVIGANCVIGQHAIIKNSYIFDDVQVEDGAQVLNSVVCEGVVICEGAKINPNCVLSHKVVISAQQEVERGTAISLCQQVDSFMEHGSDDEELEYTPRADQDDNEDEGADEAVVEIAQKLAQGLTVDKDSMKDICFAEEVVGSEGAGFVWNLVFSKNAEETALQQISHPSKKELDQYYYKLIQPQLGGTGSSTETKEENLFFKESKESGLATDDDLEQRFRKEVSETFLRCVQEGFSVDNAVLELNGLKLAENRSFADCARFMFSTICELCCPAPLWVPKTYQKLYPAEKYDNKQMLLKFQQRLKEQSDLLQKFLRKEDDQIELLLTFEELCGQEGVFAQSLAGKAFSPYFTNVLKILYDMEIVEEDAILFWAEEKAEADEEELKFLNMAQPFIDWLQTAEEDDEDEEEEDDDDE